MDEYRTRNEGADDSWGPSTAVYTSASVTPDGDSSVPDPGDTAAWRRPSSSEVSASGSTGDSARAVQWGTLPGWAALLVLIGIAAIGAIIDLASGHHLSTLFNWSIVLAAIVAVLMVRRSGIFPIVIAPPIVYAVASAVVLYARSGGLHDHKVLFDAAANWLVYGFPTMAAATAVVLIIAGVRLIAHR